MISDQTKEAIKSAVSIEEVVGEFVSLKKRGYNFLGLCPFHNERTPSFTVSPLRGTFKCFGCGKTGDSIEFIMEHEHYTFAEALRFLAEKYKIQIEDGPEILKEKNEKDQVIATLAFAQAYFRENFWKPNNPGQAYANKRDIGDDYLQGFAGDSWDGLLTAARANGITEEQLLAAGLIGKNEKGRIYDYFRNRLMFPFHDLSGRIIGFTGRLLADSTTSPKYLNSPEILTFTKGNVLFGLQQAKHAIIDEDECYLVEGNIDVISFHNKNIRNTVCSSGTALSTEQVRLIRRFTHNVTFIYDNDAAGQKAAIKSIDIAVKEGMNVYLVRLPEGTDPDSFAIDKTENDIKAFIEENRCDFVSYRFLITPQKELDDIQVKSDIVKELVSTCALVPDEITRSEYVKRIVNLFEVSDRDVRSKLKKQLPKLEAETYPGFFAFENAKEEIKTKNQVVILDKNSDVLEAHLDEKFNSVGLPVEPLTKLQIQDLSSLTKNVTFDFEFSKDLFNEADTSLIKIASLLLENSFNVLVKSTDLEFTTTHTSYIDYFVAGIKEHLLYTGKIGDDKQTKHAIERCAELLSKLDNTTITLKTPWLAQKFGINQAGFNKILKPYLDKKKNQSQLRNEDIVIDDTRYEFHIDNLPDYIDEKFFYKYGFFPAENKKGKKIFYMFRTQENTLIKVGNFFMEPLFQVFSLDANKNKRVVKLNHAELGSSEYVELPSAGMMDFAVFKKFLWNQGGYVFSKGRSYHHEMILESVALQFPKAFEFEVFGWQQEQFFAFSNGIYANGSFMPVDELGLVSHKGNTYYSPAFSVIFKDQRNDADKYKNDRFLVYKEKQETPWERWCELMKQVYTNNNNGLWSILFTIMAAHRSVIFPLERYFTAPFFIGPTESGKSRIAESICAPFTYGAPLFNLNSGTDAAFFTILERYRDVPVPLEEYNDYQISDIKFQGLKAAVYDSEGKTKRKDASTKELDTSAVNCAPIPLGQEAPERDDGSLSNRCVLLHVPKKDNWTDEEMNLFLELKNAEKNGLTNILTIILDVRPLIQQHFGKIQRQIHKQLKEELNESGSHYQTRILNTVSLFVAMAKFWQEHVPSHPLSFTFDEFLEIAKSKIITQSESITQTNRVSVFFETLLSLLNRQHGGIIEGREFKIEEVKEITVQSNKNTPKKVEYKQQPKRILYLRMNLLHPMYREINKMEALKPNALMMYLRDHPAYIGSVKSTRFSWKEVKEIANASGYPEKTIVEAQQNTNAIAIDYDKLGIDMQLYKKTEGLDFMPHVPAAVEMVPSDQELPF
ncbi:MAG: DNA primase [Bacteroidales bacterium]